METMDAIRQTFFQECEEQLIELEQGLAAIQGGNGDKETINAVFRAVHSIKGGAGAFDLADIVHFAHVFENTLDLVRTDRLEPHPGLMKIMLRATDILADLVIAGRDGVPFDESRCTEISAELSREGDAVADDAPDAGPAFVFEPIAVDLDDFGDLGFAPASPRPFVIRFAPRATLYANGNETSILFRELERLGTITVVCDDTALPTLDALDARSSYLRWTVTLETEHDEAAISEIFDFVEWDSELSIEPAAPAAIDENAPAFEPDPVDISMPGPTADEPAAQAKMTPAEPKPPAVASERQKAPSSSAAPAGSATIRVDLDRVDRLIDLVGELVINQAMLTELVADLDMPRVSPVSVGLDELEQLTREIQDSVMAIRAQPVKSVFQRLPRLVREVASQTGKIVRLDTEGEGTEVDKTVIENLVDPLTHMIRNAVDHGLERPDARRAAGKAEEGVLRLSAAHRSGRIVIEIADDGAGINRERVRAIAVDKGLVAGDARLSDEEIDNLIFLPGFSTAETVSDISGRGVGMDVVRRSIQALGGRISIASVPGKGSTFTMSLPLTLAVLDGMVVTVADQTLVVPLSTVVEILMPQTLAIHAFGEHSRLVSLRGEFIPLVDIGRRMDYRAEAVDPRKSVVILVEAEGGARNALVVDAIQGQRQVVIKSLEANYGTVAGVAAATILGNGRVALILDVDAVVAGTCSDRAVNPRLKAG